MTKVKNPTKESKNVPAVYAERKDKTGGYTHNVRIKKTKFKKEK